MTKQSSTRREFTALLEPDGSALKWTIARLPFDAVKVWPVRKGRRVRGEIEGFAFRTTLFPDPRGEGQVLLVNKKMQAAAKARQGDKVRIWLEPDLEERQVVVPVELENELKIDRHLRRWFDNLSDSMKREIGKWCAEPESPIARRRRAEKTAERLVQAMDGETDPPPVLRAIFQRNPVAKQAWFSMTEIQRRGHLLGVFYYETPEARQRRALKAVDEAIRLYRAKVAPTG